MPVPRWVSAKQIAINAVIVVISSAVVYLPSTVVFLAGRDAWMSILIAGFIFAVYAWLLIRLYFAHGQTPTRLASSVGGPWLRAAVGLLLCGYSSFVTTLVLRETSSLFTIIMPETPGGVFIAAIGFTGAILAIYGREPVLRCGELFFPVLVAISIVNLLVVLPGNTDFGELLPLLELGIWPVLAAVPPLVTWGGEILLLTVFADSVYNPKQLPRSLLSATAGIMLLMLGFTVSSITVLGTVESWRSNVPALALARQVRITAYFTRIETLLMTAWLIGTLIKTGITLYCAAWALEGGLNISGRWRVHLILFLAFITGLTGYFLVPDQAALVDFLNEYWPPVGLTAMAFMLLLGVIGRWWHARNKLQPSQ